MEKSSTVTFHTIKQLVTPTATLSSSDEVVSSNEILRMLFVYIGSGGSITNKNSFFPGVDNENVTALRNRTLQPSANEEAIYNHHRLVDTNIVLKSNKKVHFTVVPNGVRSVGLIHRLKEMKAITHCETNGFFISTEDVSGVLLKGGWVFPRLTGLGAPIGRKCAQWAMRLYNLDRGFERLLSLIFTAIDTILGCVYARDIVKAIAWEVADYVDEGTLRGCPRHYKNTRKRKVSTN